MINDAIAIAQLELIERAAATPEYLAFVRRHELDIRCIGFFIGAAGVLPVEIERDRFNLSECSGTQAFVFEAFGECGERIVDLVAIPVEQPQTTLSMFGRVGLLGAWEAMGTATYIMGGALDLHLSALDWMKSGCCGAAIVVPDLAGRQLLSAPGRIACRTRQHGLAVAKLIRAAAALDGKVIVPRAPIARAA